jgi:DMATS type aromatic prenyltransferase
MVQTLLGDLPKPQLYKMQFGLNTICVASDNIELGIHDERITPYPCYPPELLIWQRVNTELQHFESEHHRFWWNRHTGKALAVLLYNAKYPPELQYRDLKFFAQVVAPNLGISHETLRADTQPWPSFMTDDGTPLELSWDWGTRDASPTIRYSIEPIGLYAGTSLDPGNLIAGPVLQEQLRNSLPEMRLEWFHHFQESFSGGASSKGGQFQDNPDDHDSSIFYAFDLSKSGITAKVYFFPKAKGECNQSKLEVLLQAIHAAPHCTEDKLKACAVFSDFASDAANQGLEYEMLSMDLIDPLESRLKIYFRCRDTAFNSVINIMTLGGRSRNAKLYQGLGELYRLWKALFGAYTPPDEPLAEVGHRTAGILYNVEFKLGDSVPVAKIYMPVRHYSSSDEAVILGLNDYFQYHQRGKYMPDYVRAMSTLL